MRYILDMSIHNRTGALERILGRLRQRQFSICSLTADCPEAGMMTARITVESSRDPELAVKQMDKLIDVERVDLERLEGEEQDVFQSQKTAAEYCRPV